MSTKQRGPAFGVLTRRPLNFVQNHYLHQLHLRNTVKVNSLMTIQITELRAISHLTYRNKEKNLEKPIMSFLLTPPITSLPLLTDASWKIIHQDATSEINLPLNESVGCWEIPNPFNLPNSPPITHIPPSFKSKVPITRPAYPPTLKIPFQLESLTTLIFIGFTPYGSKLTFGAFQHRELSYNDIDLLTFAQRYITPFANQAQAETKNGQRGNKWERFAELSGYDVRAGECWDKIDLVTGWTERIIDLVWLKMSRRYHFLYELDELAMQGKLLNWAGGEEVPPKFGYLATSSLIR